MEIFINEASLHKQYLSRNHFLDAFKLFISSIKRINEITNNKDIFKNKDLYYYCGIEGEVFQSTLKNNPSLNQTLVQNLQKLNPKSWQKDQKHLSSSSYEFNDEDFVNTSVAELSERNIIKKNFSGFLLNFNESKFGEKPTISILKDKSTSIDVDTVITPEDIEGWLISKGFINPAEIYSEASQISPSDFQTVLKNHSVFEKTSFPRNNGRIVYRKKGTSELWVVDNSLRHAGSKAHIEVFNENSKKHLGTSLYNQINLDERYKVENRYIKLG